MADREQTNRIDAQWQTLQPGWGVDDFNGERQMLYDQLEDGESIERLWSGSWRVSMDGEAMESHDGGIVVATEDRVLLMNRGRLSKNVAVILYSMLSTVEEPETGTVRVNTGDLDYDLAAGLWASELAAFLQDRIRSGVPSTETELSRVLQDGERLERWARCTAGGETVMEYQESGIGNNVTRYDKTIAVSVPSLAVETDRRVLLYEPNYDKATTSFPSGTILGVEYWGGREVRFSAGDTEAYTLRFAEEGDAAHFAKLMRQYTANPDRRVSAQTRISAQWRLQHPLWHHRDNHGSERRKLAEVMEEGEQVEALAWGVYQSLDAGGGLHSGIIAATGWRLWFVSNGLGDKHVSYLPYEGIEGIAPEKGKLHIAPTSGYEGYEIVSMDDMNRHDSRHKGHRAAFETRLQVLVEAAPPQGTASGAVPLSRARRLRVDAQWTKRSDGWDLGMFGNERQMFYEVLQDDEDIECLIEGYYQKDVRGASDSWGVVAATERRVLYVYNGIEGTSVAELPYADIELVSAKRGFLSQTITIATRPGVDGWKIEGSIGNRGEFVDCVRNHIGR